ncbi:GntR family transcriptional regulator [Saccharobesus litoralis]|nr:GntR family transcriptional regulator [Saccharobesus litoralis]
MNQVSSIKKQIAEFIRAEIIDGAILSGTRLNEQELADRFGVSKGPIRDVLAILRKEGLVINNGKRGSFVSMALDEDVKRMYEGFSQSIKSYAVKRLKEKANKTDYTLLENHVSKMKIYANSGQFCDFINTYIEFQKYYVYLAGGEDLVNIWSSISIKLMKEYHQQSTMTSDLQEPTQILAEIKQCLSHELIEVTQPLNSQIIRSKISDTKAKFPFNF